MRNWMNLIIENASFEATPFFKEWMKWCSANDGEYFPGDYGQHNFYFGSHPNDNRVTLKYDGSNTITLALIQVAEANRRNGSGTTIMRALCAAADAAHTRLSLIADESNDGDPEYDADADEEDGEPDYDERDHWLQGWYERLGFEYTGDTSDWGPYMDREPNA